MKKILVACFILTMLGACAKARRTQTVGCCDSRNWMEWTLAERDAFMEGNVRGLMYGYNAGCDAAAEVARKSTIAELHAFNEACMARNPFAGADFTGYRDKITLFYRDYPNSKTLPVEKVIEGILREQSLARPFD